MKYKTKRAISYKMSREKRVSTVTLKSQVSLWVCFLQSTLNSSAQVVRIKLVFIFSLSYLISKYALHVTCTITGLPTLYLQQFPSYLYFLSLSLALFSRFHLDEETSKGKIGIHALNCLSYTLSVGLFI